MCKEKQPCKSGEECTISSCASKVDKNKLSASKAEKEKIISNNKLVKK